MRKCCLIFAKKHKKNRRHHIEVVGFKHFGFVREMASVLFAVFVHSPTNMIFECYQMAEFRNIHPLVQIIWQEKKITTGYCFHFKTNSHFELRKDLISNDSIE